MTEDTTLQSVFSYAKQGPQGGGEFPLFSVVFGTFVEHFPNSHPKGAAQTSADLVTYANGSMKLSQDKKVLFGEFRLWRNIFDYGNIFEPKMDAFADADGPLTVLVTVSDSGKVTHQRKLNGIPIGGMPPFPMNAVYTNGLFVETYPGAVRSVSFTLGSSPVPI